MNKKITKIALVLSVLSSSAFTTLYNPGDVLADDTKTIILTRPDDPFVKPKECIDLDGKPSEISSEETSSEDFGTEGSTSAPSGVEPWLVKGTQEYKNAKEVYDTFVKKHGTSSAFGIGVLANIARESRMIMDIKEIEGGQNYAGRGIGLFQITPAETFLNSPYAKQGDNPLSVKNQVDFVWHDNFQNKVINAYLDGNEPNAGVRLYGIPPIKGVEELISTDDPEFAARYFYAGYERGRDFDEDMVKSKAYIKSLQEVFETKVVKADKSKWNFSGSSPTAGDSSGSIDITEDSESGDESGNLTIDQGDCKLDKEEKEKGTGLFGLVGTGTHSYKDYDSWRPDELPEDLKQYALDPELVDMNYKSSKNWFDQGQGSRFIVGSQCTHFASSLFARVWTKDGKTPIEDKETPYGACAFPENNGSCDGAYLTKIWADHLKGSVSKEPHTGAIASTPATTSVPTGHVFMVSHVFENGDILIVEQNFKKSGQAAGGLTYTWEYRIQTKASYQKEKTTFFRPDNLEPNEVYGSTGGEAGEPIKGNYADMIKEGKRLMAANIPYSQGGDRWPAGANIGKKFPMGKATDCSAFVRYLWYRTFGIDVGNATGEQWNNPKLKDIKESELKPGDLLFWGWEPWPGTNKMRPRHVGMYIGDNKMIHTGNNRTRINIVDFDNYKQYSIDKFKGAKRPTK